MVVDLKTQTLVEAVASAVQQRVLAGQLDPGARVTEQDIASIYGVARPTAKAAIERVVQIGILRRTANKTARVPQLSIEDIEDLYRSRIFFERGVVAALARKRAVPDAASRALRDMRSNNGHLSTIDRVSSDIGFHRALVEGMGSERLMRMYDTIVGEAHLCMAQEYAVLDLDENYGDHENLLNAIERGDADGAQAIITKHLSDAAARLLRREINLD